MIPSQLVCVKGGVPAEYIDCRRMAGPILMLHHCKDCGKDYTVALYRGTQCGDCNRKELYPPDGIRPQDRPSLWRRFVEWLEGE